MADQIGAPGQFLDRVRVLETTDPSHPDTWNPEFKKLIDNDVDLNQRLDVVGNEVTQARNGEPSLFDRLADLEVGGAGRAVTLDGLAKWGAPARVTRPADVGPTINVTAAVAGDDSVDVDSTANLIVGQTYWLVEGVTEEAVRVASILNGTRFIAAAPLQNSYTAAATINRYNGVDKLVGLINNAAPFDVFIEGAGPFIVDEEQLDGTWLQVGQGFNGGYRILGNQRFRVAGVAPQDLVAEVSREQLPGAAGAPTSLNAGLVDEQMSQLLAALNARAQLAGDTFTGDVGGRTFRPQDVGSVPADTDEALSLTRRSVPFMWGAVDATGTLIGESWNVFMVNRVDTGLYALSSSVAPPSGSLAIVASVTANSSGDYSITVTSGALFGVATKDGGVLTDLPFHFVVFGA